MRRLASPRATSYQATSTSPFFGLCFFQTWALASRVAAAIVRKCSSRGMLPSAITSASPDGGVPAASGGGPCGAARRVRRRWRARSGSRASRRSIARQMSTLDSGARIKFSATAPHRGGGLVGIAHQHVDDRQAQPSIAAFTRTISDLIINPLSVADTQGGWMMPTAWIEGEQLVVYRRLYSASHGGLFGLG